MSWPCSPALIREQLNAALIYIQSSDSLVNDHVQDTNTTDLAMQYSLAKQPNSL